MEAKMPRWSAVVVWPDRREQIELHAETVHMAWHKLRIMFPGGECHHISMEFDIVGACHRCRGVITGYDSHETVWSSVDKRNVLTCRACRRHFR